MTRTATLRGLALAALCGLAAAPAAADGDVTVHNESLTVSARPIDRVELEVPVGEVHVEAIAGGSVTMRFALRCDDDGRCRERAEAMSLEHAISGRTLRFEIDGYPDGIGDKPEASIHLYLPARLAVAVELGVGELSIAGMRGDVAVETGVGEVRLDLPADAIASIALEAGIGEVEIEAPSRVVHEDGFLAFGREAVWQGDGEAEVRVEVGVGEARVELDGAGSAGI